MGVLDFNKIIKEVQSEKLVQIVPGRHEGARKLSASGYTAGGLNIVDNFADGSFNRGIWDKVIGTGEHSVNEGRGILEIKTVAGSNSNEVKVIQTLTGKQSVDGTLTFECRARVTEGIGTASNPRIAIGFFSPTSDTIRAVFQTSSVTDYRWFPRATIAGTSLGGAIDFVNTEWHNYKIEITANTAKFYIDNVLLETIASANVPDTESIAAGWQIDNEDANVVDYGIIEVLWSKAKYRN